MKENTIYIKLEYEEAVKAKRDILFSEMNLLKIAKRIKKYEDFRKEELNSKLNISKNIKEIKTNIGKLQRILPKLEIPEILKKPQEIFEMARTKSKIKDEYEEDIEYELKEIQERLNALQN
jgi:hypothetical protein